MKTDSTRQTKRYAILCGLAILIPFWTGCKSRNNQGPLEIVGTGACEEILKKLAKAFNQTQPDFEVIIPISIGTAGGIRAIGNDEYVLGRVSRQITDKEAHLGLSYLPFAKDPIVFAVGNNVKIQSLSTEQITEIYSGKITNWKELGGAENPIRVLGREKGETSRSIIEKKLKSFEEIEQQTHIKVVYHDYEMVDLFDKYLNAIGYLTNSSLNKNINPVSIDGVSPTADNVSSGRYPFVTEYAFVFKEKSLDKRAEQFLDFIFSEPGRSILEANNISPVSRKQNDKMAT